MSKIEKLMQDARFEDFSTEIETNFVYRPPISVINILRSDAESIRRFMDCNWDEVLVLRFSDETSVFLSKLEDVSDVSFEREYLISGNRWQEKTKNLFRLPGESVPVYPRDYGILIRRKDWTKVKGFISTISLSPSSYDLACLDKVYWDTKTSSLKNDVIFFSKSKNWFDKRDLPYSRSYLLYGPPGNGKTSAIRAISQYFRSSPSTFSFTGRYEDPDSAFLSWVSGDEEPKYNREDYDEQPVGRLWPTENNFSRTHGTEENSMSDNPRVRILLLEDVDRFFSKEEGFKTPVSFSAILNALDGVAQRKNSILIATANNPEKIDSQVLFRPGRFDLRIPFESPTKDGIVSFLRKLGEEDSISESMIEKVADSSRGHSFAFVKGVYMSAANRAFARASEVISDEDIFASLSEFLSNMGKDIKSSKGGAGF
jgi:Cdc6-like AAA superfamily ATPase